MARPLRIEFPGAVYHVPSRGDRREPIFVDDQDCHGFLDVVTQALFRFDAEILAYCLLGNHYHFVLHTSGNCQGTCRLGGLTHAALSKADCLWLSADLSGFKYTTFTGFQFRVSRLQRSGCRVLAAS